MSFGLRCDHSGIEYATHSPGSVLARSGAALRPDFAHMLRDIPRFHRDARALLARGDEKQTVGDFLVARRYSRAFVEWHLLPMAAAIWSARLDRLRDFPALSLARFFENHGLLSLADRIPWRVVRGGSRRYAERRILSAIRYQPNEVLVTLNRAVRWTRPRRSRAGPTPIPCSTSPRSRRSACAT